MKTAEEVFAALREFFNAPNPEVEIREKKRVWDVLGALRGPDNETEELKYASTAIVRWKVLGTGPSLWAVTHHDTADWAKARTEAKATMRSGDQEVSFHFLIHIRNAFDALGLRWGENND